MKKSANWLCYVIFICMINIIIVPNILMAQSKDKLTPQPKTLSHDEKWEYLVISFGKTLFADPISEPELKQIGLSKLLPFAQAGIVSANEAVTTQHQMDNLGRYGWELVAIIGAIGGDQQLVFKRPYDASRSGKETALIKEEGKLLAAKKREFKDELAKKALDEIIDLDAAEVQELVDNEVKILKQQIMSEKGIIFKEVNIQASQKYTGEFSADIIIIVDGSASLLKDNKYRKSEATEYAKFIANKLRDTINLTSERYGIPGPDLDAVLGNVKISVIVALYYMGKDNQVASARTGGKKNWSDGKVRQKKNI